MNRQEFMKRLEELLTDISIEEKEEALAYYTGYFEDAGEENEEKIIQELESPEQLAASIKAGLREDATGEYTERGYRMVQKETQESENQQSENQQSYNQQQNYNQQQSNGQQQQANYHSNTSASQPPRNNTLTIIMVAVIAVITFPIWAGLVGALFGIFVGLIGIMIGIIATLFSLTIAGLVGGFAVCGAGIVRLCTGGLASGLMILGIGALMVAVGVLFLILGVLFCGQFLPWVLRGFVKLCRMPFQNRKERCRV